ncbi:sugar ABC transporter substrate-binding protein [Rhodococcus sp. NBC_00294]|uniref:sugar ABC transporter substrate-binding protein n=1 Tax=Rhodococcus sp. NBC_00294 TaxID=2976004 RepID=UPI002E28E1D7|nr:substrate-binding domain-containing protein [Rhodococcus sp. NBC_00294]
MSPSRRSTLHQLARRFAGVVVIATLFCGVSACSTPSTESAPSGGSLTAAQQECVDKADAYFETRAPLPESLPPELTPLSKKPREGLTITRVFAGAVPTDAEVSRKMNEAAPVLGWTGKSVAYDGSVEDANRKLLDAIGNSDIVTLAGVPESALQAPIAAAKDKGVLLMLDSKNPPVSIPGFGATVLGGDLWTQIGEPAAYAALKATNCQGSVAVFGVAADAMRDLAAGIDQTMKQECTECGYSYTELPFSDIGSPAATTAVTSKLQADPSVALAFFTVGDLAKGIEPALKQAGLQTKIAGALPSASNLVSLEQGKDEFWLGLPQDMTAWLVLDTAARALDSGQPTVGNVYPVPLYTSDNIETTDEVPVYPKNYRAEFETLWKVTP